MLLLPAYLGAHLVWVEDSMIGLPTIRTYRRVVKAVTEAFTLAAYADQGREADHRPLFFLAIHGEVAWEG